MKGQVNSSKNSHCCDLLLFTGNDVVTLSSSFAARRWKFRVFVSAPDMQMRLQKENNNSRKILEFTHVSTHKSGHPVFFHLVAVVGLKVQKILGDGFSSSMFYPVGL